MTSVVVTRHSEWKRWVGTVRPTETVGGAKEVKFDAAKGRAVSLLPILTSLLVNAGAKLRSVYDAQERHNQALVPVTRKRKWKQGDTGDEFGPAVYAGSSRTSDPKSMTLQRNYVDEVVYEAQTAVYDFKANMNTATKAMLDATEKEFDANGEKKNMVFTPFGTNANTKIVVRAALRFPPHNAKLEDTWDGFVKAGTTEFADALSMETSPVPHLVITNKRSEKPIAVAYVPFNDSDRERAGVPVVVFVSSSTGSRSVPMPLLPAVAKPLHVSHERVGSQIRYLTGTGFADDDSTYEHLQFDERYTNHLADLMALAAVK